MGLLQGDDVGTKGADLGGVPAMSRLDCVTLASKRRNLAAWPTSLASGSAAVNSGSARATNTPATATDAAASAHFLRAAATTPITTPIGHSRTVKASRMARTSRSSHATNRLSAVTARTPTMAQHTNDSARAGVTFLTIVGAAGEPG
jgi:hypothetical protein